MVQSAGSEDQTQYSSKHIILATGARARTLPDIAPEKNHAIWTYKEAMIPDSMPESLVVIGSGAIGIEFASFYLNLGVQVSVIEMVDRILPNEDREISHLAHQSFEKQGMRILTGANVTSVVQNDSQLKVTIMINDKSEEISADRVILAVGIVGNVEDIGIEETNIRVDKSHILVNQWLETDEPSIYAIGDVVGPPWLAHKASHEGIVCVEHMAGIEHTHPLDSRNIPSCTYSYPQIASVGLSEEAAKEQGYTIRIGRFPFIANGKAIALGETEGLIKTVFDANTGELLGAHMVGTEVTEMIQGYTIAKTLETTEQELIHTIFPHPTLSEIMHEAVLDAYDRAIHF